MAWRIAKHTMGIQNVGENTHRRDAISTNVQKWGSHPNRGQTYKLQGTQPWRKQERRGHTSTARFGRRSQGDSRTKVLRYQDRMAKHYNSKVRHRDFKIGDLILRKVMGTTRDPTQGKLSPNWEGIYRITSWQRMGTYHLETIDGQKLPHPWNTEHLRKYY